MYRFILGGAASGKTTYIYKELIRESLEHPGERYFLFVPEQNTLKAQLRLAELSPRGGILNIDVLSFTLLTYRVLDELGQRKPDILDDMTKSLMLRKAMSQQKKELRIYGKKTDSEGLLSELKQAVAEFCQYDIDSERLKQAAEGDGISRRLSDKLHDIIRIYDAFNEMLGSFELIPEELPKLLLRLLPKSALLKGGHIYFDGFTGYTPIQQRILAHILEQAEDVSLAVTLPSELKGQGKDRKKQKTDDTDIFWLSRESITAIGELGDRGGVPHGEDLWLPSRKGAADTELWQHDSLYAEVRALAHDIRERVLLSDEDIRFSDIGVAVSELGSYRELIKNELDKIGIPYFIDENAGSGQSVTAELMLTSLSIIVKGYRYEDVSRYAKSPLLRIGSGEDTDDLTDIFDNYIRARGLRGRNAYEAELRTSYRGAEGLDLGWLNEYKAGLLGPIFELHDRLKTADRLSDYAAAMEDFASDIGLTERVRDFAERLRERGFVNEASAEERVGSESLLLLSRMSSLLGDEESSMKGFFELLRAGVSSIRAGLIPQSMDMLTVGDLKRSRFDGIKYLYILGANEGEIPKTGSPSGIFTEQERDELQELGLDMAPQSVKLLSSEEFYLYLLLHKPSRRLIISWPKEDRDGRSLRPAEFIGRLGLKTEAIRSYVPANDREALSSFAEKLSRGEALLSDQSFLTLYNFLRRDRKLCTEVGGLMDAAFGIKAEPRLSREAAAGLYGERLYGSVTRIESFERCAYAHFLRYGLELKERRRYDIEAVDIGNLYHAAIEGTFRELSRDRKDLRDISEEELRSIGRRASETVTASYNDNILQSSSRNSFLREKVLSITDKTLWALRSQASKGDFRTAFCEMPFRLKSDGLELHGRIDRVDLSEDSVDTYVRVIDYKSGRTKFDLSLIYNGLQLQLVTYMDVALTEIRRRRPHVNVLPAGLYYYNIDDPVIKWSELAGSEDPKAQAGSKALFGLRMNGISNSEGDALSRLDRELYGDGNGVSDVVPLKLKGGAIVESASSVCGTKGFERLMQRTRERISLDIERIQSGDISLDPYKLKDVTGCRYCPYHSVCGFDSSLPGHDFRRIRELSKAELKQRLFDGMD